MRSTHVVILLSLVTFQVGCMAGRGYEPQILVSDGVHSFDSAAGTLTRHHCHKPEETVQARLPAAELVKFVEEAKQAGLFGEREVFRAEASQDGAIQLERICVTSYVPPYRLRIESENQVFDETWNRCPPHEDDYQGMFLHEAPAKVISALITDERESFSGYDCRWR